MDMHLLMAHASSHHQIQQFQLMLAVQHGIGLSKFALNAPIIGILAMESVPLFQTYVRVMMAIMDYALVATKVMIWSMEAVYYLIETVSLLIKDALHGIGTSKSA